MNRPFLEEYDDRFSIGQSTLSSGEFGLFARQPLVSGEVLRVIGIWLKPGSTADACTHFADAYKFQVGDHLLLAVGFAALVNHSTSPNLEKVDDADGLILRTLRAISPGEELFLCYSPYACERFGLDGAVAPACSGRVDHS